MSEDNITFKRVPMKRRNQIIGQKYTTQLVNKKGHFSIQTYNYGKSGVHSDMTISVNNSLQGKGYAKKLVKAMLNKLDTLNVNYMDIIYIDTDASNGFWNYIGMVNSNNPIFEKQIKYNKLKQWTRSKPTK